MTPHPQIALYMQRKHIDASSLRSDGRLMLNMGARHRMQMQPLPSGGLLFEARIAPLPADATQREQRIERLLRAGAARLASHPQGCVIDAEAQAFVLQQPLHEELSPVAFEAEVEAFLRSLVFWKHVESQA
jgi:Tir chaperone protein (CesT) family